MSKKYVRFQIDSEVAYGELHGEEIRRLDGSPLGGYEANGKSYAYDEVRLLAPAEPTKIVGVGLNYRSHLGGRKLPETPELFYKPPSSLIGPAETIRIPEGASDVHFEGELVIVIGKRCKAVSTVDARDAIFGVTCGNDVSDRGWQRGEQKDLQWWRAKGCDTFAPLGPAVVTGLDYGNLSLETKVNGQTAQQGSTGDLVHDCPSIVSWASRWITLEPGDLIYTGTPGNTFALKPGDLVEVEIEGIGVLQNSVS